jgi:hypothetical protein
VTDNSQAMAAAVVGAVVGGIGGYLLFTARGRELRRQLEPALDDFVRELSSFRSTVHKIAGVAGESWKVVNEAIGESAPPASRYPSVHQTTPF